MKPDVLQKISDMTSKACLILGVLTLLGGGNSNICYFHPELGKILILTNIFSDGLVQPPTSLPPPLTYNLFFCCSQLLP